MSRLIPELPGDGITLKPEYSIDDVLPGKNTGSESDRLFTADIQCH